MALVAEDGTGLSGAESYVSVVAFKAYADARGLSYAGYSDTVIEQKLRLAAEYVDTRYRFKGTRLVSTQALEFPRASLVDWSANTITGVPARVKNAACELAVKALTNDLYADLDRGGMVKSESVGPISVTYADGAPAGKVWTAAENALKPYLRDPNVRGAPRYGTDMNHDGYFTLGMMDMSGVDPADATE